MSERFLLLFTMTLLMAATASAQSASREREEIVVIKAGQVITGTGETIENGMVVVIDGKIAAVGRSVEYPRTARVIDARKETIMPGLIHSRTRHGLPNYSRSGQRAHLAVADEVYLELIDFEDLLRAGYTSVCFIPAGAGLPGRSAVYRTGGPLEHRRLKEAGYLRVTMTNPARDKRVLRDALRNARNEIEKIEKAREEWEKKQAEQANRQSSQEEGDKKDSNGGENDAESKPEEPAKFKPPDIEPPLRPLVDLIQRKEGAVALIELSNASDLLHAEEIIDRYDDLPVMFYVSPGSGEFQYVVERLGERKALVLTGPNLARLPHTVVRYNLVADLFRAGAEVAIVPTGAPDRMRSMLADLTRSGLRQDEAIRAITVNAARVAGIDDRLGAIEDGKEADIVFLDGHPLDGLSKVTRTMIRGEIVWSSGDDS